VAEGIGSNVVGAIPNDPLIAESEMHVKTMIVYKPEFSAYWSYGSFFTTGICVKYFRVPYSLSYHT